MADDKVQEEEAEEVGPMPAPAEEEEEADVGPTLPKAKKRKV